MTERFQLSTLAAAARGLQAGGVLAYPTEAVFGLGCDPAQHEACAKIFALKQRPAAQSVLLIGASLEMLTPYIELSRVPAAAWEQVRACWPGPVTWVFPRSAQVPPWLAPGHSGIALRWTAHAAAAALCQAFGGALVSTSANPHGAPPARDLETVQRYFGEELDGMLDAPVGAGERPSEIRDVLSGALLRG